MLISLLLAAPSMAASPEFGVGVFGGYNTYRMNDVDFSVIPVDNLSSGISFGGGLRIRTSPSVLLSLDYERLTGTTSSFGSTNGVSYDLDLHMPADAIIAGATYYFPSDSKGHFGLTVGVGYYMADGSGTITLDDGVNNVTLTGDVAGSGLGLHGGAAASMAISTAAHLEAMVGYRFAKTGDLEGSNRIQLHGFAEWSGLMARMGLSFFLGDH